MFLTKKLGDKKKFGWSFCCRFGEEKNHGFVNTTKILVFESPSPLPRESDS